MLPLIGPPLRDPPRLGRGPPPRLKFPRLWKPPLNAGGGRKPRGGRLKPPPPRGPGAADRSEAPRVSMRVTNGRHIIRTQRRQRISTSSEVASVLEAPAAPPSLSGSTAASAAAAELVLAAPAAAAQASASLRGGAALVGLLLRRQRRLALLLVLLQQLAGLLLLQLGVDDVAEALALLGQRVEAWRETRGRGQGGGT